MNNKAEYSFLYLTPEQLAKKGWKGKTTYNLGNGKTSRGIWMRLNSKGEILDYVKLGNRLKNSDGSYSQLNSDGTSLKIYDPKTKKFAKNVSTTDLKAIQQGLVSSLRNPGKWREDIVTPEEYYDKHLEENMMELQSNPELLKVYMDHGSDIMDATKKYSAFNYYNYLQKIERGKNFSQAEKTLARKYIGQTNSDRTIWGTLQEIQDQMRESAERSNAISKNMFNYRKDNMYASKEKQLAYENKLKLKSTSELSKMYKDRAHASAEAADLLEKSMVYGTAAGLGGVAALESGIASWAGKTLWEGGKYMITHPIESFVINPTIENAAENYVFNNIENENVRKGLSMATSLTVSPNISLLGRRFLGTPLLSKLTTMLDNTIMENIPKYTMNSLTNTGMRYNPGKSMLGNMVTNTYHTVPLIATAAVVGGSGIDEKTNTGIVPIDYAKSALLYGAVAKGTNKGNTLIRNGKLATSGSQTPSEGLKNIIKNTKEHGIWNFFKENPLMTDPYLGSYKPSEKLLLMVDALGTNIGKGGLSPFAHDGIEELGVYPLRNYSLMQEGSTIGNEGMTLVSKSYVGAPVTSKSSIQEILTNRSNAHFTGDTQRQALGSREAVINSYGEKIQTPKELIDEGFTEFVGSDKKLRSFTEDPTSIDNLYMTMGRGDFLLGNGYSYNGAGQRIVGIFHNPTTKLYKIYMQDPSGIGSVAHQGGQSSAKKVLLEVADSDVPFTHVFKSATISSPEEFNLFINRYMQSVPNKSHVNASPRRMLESFFGFGKNRLATEASNVIAQIRGMEGTTKGSKKLQTLATLLENVLNSDSKSLYEKQLLLDNLKANIKKIDGSYAEIGNNIKLQRQKDIQELMDILSLNGLNYSIEVAKLDQPMDYSKNPLEDLLKLMKLRPTITNPESLRKIDLRISELSEYRDALQLARTNDRKDLRLLENSWNKVNKNFFTFPSVLKHSAIPFEKGILSGKELRKTSTEVLNRSSKLNSLGRTILGKVMKVYLNKKIPTEVWKTYPKWLQLELVIRGFKTFKTGGKLIPKRKMYFQ